MNPDFKIALIGNPNSGKTTLFNTLTGLRQKVGNYPGITIDRKSGYWKINKELTAEVLDLPGTYSIYPKRPDERIAIETILNIQNDLHPDLIIVVCDATALQRNILLCTQIIDTGIPVVVALTMSDVAQKDHISVDRVKLSELLGVPVADVSFHLKNKMDELKEAILIQYQRKQNLKSHYQPQHDVFSSIRNELQLNSNYLALLTANASTQAEFLNANQKQFIQQSMQQYQIALAGWQADEVLHRFKLNQQILSHVVHKHNKDSISRQWTKRIDDYLLHPLWGYMVFLLVFFLIFQALFNWAEYPMEAINELFAQASSAVLRLLPDSMFSRLLAEGILPGIGGIIAFVPQITLLFGFISVLEETGYMSRVSLLTDKIFHRIGMNGKSSVSLIGGLACAVPAIMGTRTIENYKDRLITILVTPLMSCSARLPVYVLLIGFVVPDKDLYGIINLQGMVMLGLYLLGFITALLVALILKLFIKVKETGTYIAELPIYRKPRWGNVLFTMYEKVRLFVWEAGKIIMLISVLLWFLASFGPGRDMEYAEETALLTYKKADSIELKNQVQSAKLNASYAGVMGRWIEPVIAPLGFDWKMGIAIITSFAAREVFVGTMATIYSIGSKDEPDFEVLREKMQQDTNPNTGEAIYNTASGLALIIFYVFAMQCMSTLAVVKRETKSWKWPVVQFVYMTVLAWVTAWITYILLS